MTTRNVLHRCSCGRIVEWHYVLRRGKGGNGPATPMFNLNAGMKCWAPGSGMIGVEPHDLDNRYTDGALGGGAAMTAATVTPVRGPLLAEMQDAAVTAVSTDDPTRRAFYTGLFTGYAVGFGLQSREALNRARLEPGALNLHIDVRRPRWNDDDNTLWACGVRHGYWLATSERPDATDCDLCGERVTTDDDTDSCEHGVFCESGCITDWHAGVTLDRCSYLDNRYTDGAL